MIYLKGFTNWKRKYQEESELNKKLNKEIRRLQDELVYLKMIMSDIYKELTEEEKD